jgi:ParB family transcriptional regulator, chromosome partitioning protein
MNLTTVAHHLALLNLPPELDEAMRSGRCTSPRTLHELSKPSQEQPERIRALVASDAEITRNTVAELRAMPAVASEAMPRPTRTASLIAKANTSCARLEQTRLTPRSAATSIEPQR